MTFRRLANILLPVLIMTLMPAALVAAGTSSATEACLGCHRAVTPGIVADWESSRHSEMTVAEALKKPEIKRRVSLQGPPADAADNTIGCAECHTRNAEKHPDTFDHNGFRVHPVVSPDDCAACHPVERRQYDGNIMAHAYANLNDNPLYESLVEAGIGTQHFSDGGLTLEKPNSETLNDACNYCHGTKVKVTGQETRETAMGPMTFPKLSGWPNQGTGRINPDGSKGACTSCHPRHSFSIEIARKPATCSECHKGPDVPAYKVYKVSKHGNIYSAKGDSWNWSEVPWTVGRDFNAPTCATCHAALLVDPDGEVLAERTHSFKNRLAWRIFGLPYAHPQPKSPDTTIIRNRAGLPLPTELSGEPASKYLIDKDEQDKRRQNMSKVCSGCHGGEWIAGHFTRLDNTIRVTNAKTLAATAILQAAWGRGLAQGPESNANLFDEAIEKQWVEQWLFFANSTRFASAMAGADYGVFANGRWYLNKNVAEMKDRLELLEAAAEKR